MKALSTLTTLACAGALLLGVQHASALSYTLDFSPNGQVRTVGQSAFVDIVVTETGGPGAVGAFILDIEYDPSFVSFVGATDAGELGLSLGLSASDAGGVITLDDVSFEVPAVLVALQGNPFVLATLEFSAVAVGISPLVFNYIDLSDQDGLAVDGTGPDPDEFRFIEVVADGGGVPDGGTTAALLGAALVGLVGLKKRLGSTRRIA